MALLSDNVTFGPEGSCSILLLFGAKSRPGQIRPIHEPPPTDTNDRSSVERCQERTVQKSHTIPHTTFRRPQTNENICTAPTSASWIRGLCLSHCQKLWERHHTFGGIIWNSAVIQRRRGRTMYRSTCIRSFLI